MSAMGENSTENGVERAIEVNELRGNEKIAPQDGYREGRAKSTKVEETRGLL